MRENIIELITRGKSDYPPSYDFFEIKLKANKTGLEWGALCSHKTMFSHCSVQWRKYDVHEEGKWVILAFF